MTDRVNNNHIQHTHINTHRIGRERESTVTDTQINDREQRAVTKRSDRWMTWTICWFSSLSSTYSRKHTLYRSDCRTACNENTWNQSSAQSNLRWSLHSSPNKPFASYTIYQYTHDRLGSARLNTASRRETAWFARKPKQFQTAKSISPWCQPQTFAVHSTSASFSVAVVAVAVAVPPADHNMHAAHDW